MKKKTWIFALICIAVLAILFIPVPGPSYDDGGTREFTALTYNIVRWHRLYDDGTDKTASMNRRDSTALRIGTLPSTRCGSGR